MKKKSKTKRKQVPRKINSKIKCPHHQLLFDFMNSVPDVIYFKDKKGKLVLVNKAYAQGLGLEPEQVVGKTDFDIFPAKKAQKMARDDAYVMKTGKPIIDKIERGTRADGVDNYVSTTKIPRYDNKGKVIGLMGVTRDVTRRVRGEHSREEREVIEKRLEVLQDFDKIKSEFISAVSHELRTPLAVIKQLLLLVYNETTGPISNKQREVLVRVGNNIERLKVTIDKLLDMAHIERKTLKLRYSLINLNDLLRESKEFFKELAKGKNIRLNYHLSKEEVNIFIDAERVIQVITNLINNAIKFTEANGRIDVEVKVLANKIRVGVIDTGFGIAPADLPKVFDKFVQVSKAGAEGRAGIGLGLAIVKDLIEQHDGEVWVESQLGVGSKFYFTLPRFHTLTLLTDPIKKRINHFLKQDIRVFLINLVIVNYDEFEKRIKIASEKLAKDLKVLVNTAFEEFFHKTREKSEILITDFQKGKCSIVFPNATDKEIVAFCEFLKKEIKSYFTKHKIEDVFIALGMMSYSPEISSSQDQDAPARFNIREIYIGAEMRRFKRIKYETEIEVISSGKEREVCQTMDISRIGMCFFSRRPYKTDMKINVKFDLLRKKGVISTKARVAWLRRMDRLPQDTTDKYKVGVEFIALSKKDRELLSQELGLYYG